jgi:hypothetical protein
VTVKEKGADAVVEGAEHTLGPTVLLRGVWTSEAENSAVRGQKVANKGIDNRAR